MSNANEIPQADAPLKEGKGIFEIESSRGKIVVRDQHVFTIEVPSCEELVIIVEGRAFRIKGLLDASKEVDHTGKRS